jgi:hypothetical protein
LTEIVGIIYLRSEGKSKQEIAQLTGRSVHSLQYKFYEGPVQLKDKDGNVKTVTRSILKYTSMEELYADHGQAWSAEDQNARVEEFLNNLTIVETEQAS